MLKRLWTDFVCKPKAAVISVADLELLEELEDAQAAREALAAYEAGETVSYEEYRAELLVAEGLLKEPTLTMPGNCH